MIYTMFKNLNIFILGFCLVLFGLGGCIPYDKKFTNCPSVEEMTNAYQLCMENSRSSERTRCPYYVKQLLCKEIKYESLDKKSKGW